MGFILYVIATIIYIPLTIINIIYVLARYAKEKSYLKVINEYFRETAIDMDKFGNHNFRTLFNATLKNKVGYKFGVPTETISSAIGKNKQMDSLTKAGKVVDKILDLIEEDHSIKSINNNV